MKKRIRYARVKRKDIKGQCCHCKYGQAIDYKKRGKRHCEKCENDKNGWVGTRFYL